MQRAMRCVDEREGEDDMTGLDCLKEELLKRGCTKQQADSKVVPVVLEILANNGTPYTEMEEAKDELSRIKNSIPDALQARYYQVKEETRILENRLRDLQVAILNRENEYKNIKSVWDEEQAYIEAFLKEMQNCETAEARDAMRRVQLFKNSVTVDTKYDNTAYIVALGAILSDGEVGAIETLKKVNPDLVTSGKERLKEKAMEERRKHAIYERL